MPKIRVTNECMCAIRGAATAPGGFKQTGNQLPNGDWELEVLDATYDRILKICTGGKTVSDAIMLALSITQGRVH